MTRSTIDDVAEGPQVAESGDLVGPKERKFALRFVDYASDVMFAAGAGTLLGTMYDKQVVYNEEAVAAIGGAIIAMIGFSSRVANIAIRYAHNRGTYTSFLDFIRRV